MNQPPGFTVHLSGLGGAPRSPWTSTTLGKPGNKEVLGHTLGLGFRMHLLSKYYIIKQVPGIKTMSSYKRSPYF